MTKKQGVLLVNLGTPSAPEKQAVKEYLARFLGDKRVIDKPRWQWLPILHGIILNVRPKKSAALYQKIWTDKGSPLLFYTQSQAKQLQARLPEVVVRYAMSYSEPFIQNELQIMQTMGIDELVIVPLYPQYSSTTVAPIFDEVATFYLKQTKIPILHFVSHFYDHPCYINDMVKRLQMLLQQQPIDKVLFSYHGIPVSYVERGDDYPLQCEATTRLVMESFADLPYEITYQSQFGRDPWVTPNTATRIKSLPKEGVSRLAILTPAFMADCLETLEEIEVENRGYFMENGGEQFTFIHPLNDSPAAIDLLTAIVTRELAIE